jgi:hypothetical protein
MESVNIDFELDSKRVADYFSKSVGNIMACRAIMETCNLYFENSHVEFIRSKQMWSLTR